MPYVPNLQYDNSGDVGAPAGPVPTHLPPVPAPVPASASPHVSLCFCNKKQEQDTIIGLAVGVAVLGLLFIVFAALFGTEKAKLAGAAGAVAPRPAGR